MAALRGQAVRSSSWWVTDRRRCRITHTVHRSWRTAHVHVCTLDILSCSRSYLMATPFRLVSDLFIEANDNSASVKFILTALKGLQWPTSERKTRTRAWKKPFKKPWKWSLQRKPPSKDSGKIKKSKKHVSIFVISDLQVILRKILAKYFQTTNIFLPEETWGVS